MDNYSDPWVVASFGNAWYVQNRFSGTKTRVGPFRWHGRNHRDRAGELAQERNRKTARLRRVRIEVGQVQKGRPGYIWKAGYEVITPDGNPLQPYMGRIEAKQFCKKQGWLSYVTD